MDGSMRQRSAGSWELRVFAGRDPETGKRRYRTRTVRANRAEATRELAKMVREVRAIRQIGAGSPMSDLLEAWFAIAAASWAPTTVRQTRSVLDRYLHPHIGAVRVGELTTARIDRLYAELGQAGGIGGKPLAPATLARTHVVLRSALAHAVRWEWIWDNPAERAHRIQTPPAEQSPPTVYEVAVLLGHVERHQLVFHLFLVVAAFCGARRAQILGLRWRNISFERARIAFCAGWVEGPNGPVLAATKTKRRHAVDIDPGTLALLEAHADRCRAANGGVLPPDGFLFSDCPTGTAAWKPNRVTKAFARTRTAAGLRHFRLRELRDFMATEMIDAGVPLPVVARRLDHRRTSTTLDRYAHAVPGRDALAAEALWHRVHDRQAG